MLLLVSVPVGFILIVRFVRPCRVQFSSPPVWPIHLASIGHGMRSRQQQQRGRISRKLLRVAQTSHSWCNVHEMHVYIAYAHSPRRDINDRKLNKNNFSVRIRGGFKEQEGRAGAARSCGPVSARPVIAQCVWRSRFNCTLQLRGRRTQRLIGASDKTGVALHEESANGEKKMSPGGSHDFGVCAFVVARLAGRGRHRV